MVNWASAKGYALGLTASPVCKFSFSYTKSKVMFSNQLKSKMNELIVKISKKEREEKRLWYHC
jgi:hypothetical protein